MSIDGDGFVRIHADDLDEIAWTLGVIEDWLLHAPDDVYNDLAAFAGHGPFTNPAHRHGRLIAGHCGDHVVTIRRRLRAHDPQP